MFRTDAVASELSTWATTIIRLPGLKNVEKLADQLRAFETQFLLFAPSVSELALRADRYGIDEVYSAQRSTDDRVALTAADGSSSRWIVRHRDYKPSLTARAEVGEMVARNAVRLTIASRLDATEKKRCVLGVLPSEGTRRPHPQSSTRRGGSTTTARA